MVGLLASQDLIVALALDAASAQNKPTVIKLSIMGHLLSDTYPACLHVPEKLGQPAQSRPTAVFVVITISMESCCSVVIPGVIYLPWGYRDRNTSMNRLRQTGPVACVEVGQRLSCPPNLTEHLVLWNNGLLSCHLYYF